MKRNCIKTLTFTTLIILTLLTLPALAEQNITSIRTISDTDVEPGDCFEVSVELNTIVDKNGPAIDEVLPEGWTVEEIDYMGAVFKEDTTEWIWAGTITPENGRTISYRVTVPSDAADGDYQITGKASVYKAKEQSEFVTTTGQSEVHVSSPEEEEKESSGGMSGGYTPTETVEEEEITEPAVDPEQEEPEETEDTTEQENSPEQEENQQEDTPSEPTIPEEDNEEDSSPSTPGFQATFTLIALISAMYIRK